MRRGARCRQEKSIQVGFGSKPTPRAPASSVSGESILASEEILGKATSIHGLWIAQRTVHPQSPLLIIHQRNVNLTAAANWALALWLPNSLQKKVKRKYWINMN